MSEALIWVTSMALFTVLVLTYPDRELLYPMKCMQSVIINGALVDEDHRLLSPPACSHGMCIVYATDSSWFYHRIDASCLVQPVKTFKYVRDNQPICPVWGSSSLMRHTVTQHVLDSCDYRTVEFSVAEGNETEHYREHWFFECRRSEAAEFIF